MTGDVNVNPDASCLVMTTEILRNMLYKGHDIVHEVQWVIFDEVHYMRDKERGVIWEEAIILLPHASRFVFLSATIPNAFEFASWVAATHDVPCHVISTAYRCPRPQAAQPTRRPHTAAEASNIVTRLPAFSQPDAATALGVPGGRRRALSAP